jgi:hypothetical protein
LTFKRPSSVFCLRAWRTVHGHRADCPRGTIQQVVLRVRRVFLSAFVSIRLASCSWLEVVSRTVRLDVADRPRGTSCSRTVQGQGVDHMFFRVCYRRFCWLFRTVRREPFTAPTGIVRLVTADRSPGLAQSC